MSESSTPKTVVITGPFITNFSFARVNRGIALALAKLGSEYTPRIWVSDADTDKVATKEDLVTYNGLSEIVASSEPANADIVIFNNFPKDPNADYGLANLPGKLKLMYMAWEETVFPEAKAREMNEHLHGVIVASQFTADILRRNGVKIPIRVVLNAIDDEVRNATPLPYSLQSKKRFKFLNVSTARARKGIDVLLKAYFAEFTAQDDVTLVLKSFPNRDNLINELLVQLKTDYPNAPEVVHILNPNLTEQELADITHTADCAVYPTRAEGFGLPIAEAMHLGTPVIVTGYSAHMEFANEGNSLVLDYELVDAHDSELANLGAKWAEPNIEDLRKQMRYIFENRDSARVTEMVAAAREAVQDLSWERAAREIVEFLREIESVKELKAQKVAVITPINTVSGIAEYSRDLYSKIEHSFDEFTYLANMDTSDRTRDDTENVVRLWEQGDTKLDKVADWLDQHKPDILHIQLHPAELLPAALQELMMAVKQKHPALRAYLTPHSVVAAGIDLGSHVDLLHIFDKIFVHKQKDFDYLTNNGLTNLELYPLPFDYYPKRAKSRIRQKLGISGHPIIATHGLVSAHKGLLETAEAVAKLKQDYPGILWLAMNAVNINNATSAGTFAQLQELVEELGIKDNVRFFSDFLAAEELVLLIQASDIGVLAYSEVGESASAAIRKFMATDTPTIVTDIPMMAELGDEVWKIKNSSPEEILLGLRQLLENPEQAKQIAEQAQATSAMLSWERQAVKLLRSYSVN